MILTTRQKIIAELYESGLSGNQISKKLQITRSTIYKELDYIIHGEEISKHKPTKPVVEHITLEAPDFLIETMDKANFTDEQRKFVLQNKFLGRSLLAKKLKINKTVFNHILQKENIMI